MKQIFVILFSMFLFAGVSGNAQTKDTVTNEEKIFNIVEVKPEFPGGQDSLDNFLRDNLKYPREAIEVGLEGTVFVRFVVEKDGSITNVEVRRSVHRLLDEEAVRVTKLMPIWKPGTQIGKPVRVSFTLPINFQLK